jgi:hypothetical protein
MKKILREFEILYSQLISWKKIFIDMYPNEIEDNYLVSVQCFSREMFLDPSECENPSYMLPQLTRDSFSKKGIFYRTDKILI